MLEDGKYTLIDYMYYIYHYHEHAKKAVTRP